MAVPSQPQNFILQTANGQILASWDLSAGSLSYNVNRSVDNITFSLVANVTSIQYLDTAVTVGTQYYYNVSAVNVDGSSIPTATLSAVPTRTGENTLGQLRLMAQQRADLVNSQFVTKSEWDSYINQSYFELYDLLVTVYEDYFVAQPAIFTTNSSQFQYPLPNGSLSFTSTSGTSFVAKPFYKLMGVDVGLQTNTNAWATLTKFNFTDRNNWIFPNSGSTIYGVYNMQYRLLGIDTIEFIPTPAGNMPVRLWYIPRLDQLLLDTDTTIGGISGWNEYIITDAAIKALQKEESDVTILALQKAELIKRIQASASNRDAGKPDTISDVRGRWGTFGGGNFGGFQGGGW